MNAHNQRRREAALDVRMREAIAEETHLLQLKSASDARKIKDAQEAEVALRQHETVGVEGYLSFHNAQDPHNQMLHLEMRKHILTLA